MRKRIWAAILSLCVALTMMPTAFALEGVVPGIKGPALGSAHPLTAGTYYLLDNDGVPQTAGASADNYNVYYTHEDTDIVVFKNAALKTPIYVMGNTTVEFYGNNTSGSEEKPVSVGIQTMSEGDLRIAGTGTYTAYNCEGILTTQGNDDIIISGSTINVLNIYAGANSSKGSLFIQGDAKVTAPKITASDSIEISGNAEVDAVRIEAEQKAVMKGSSKTVVNGNDSLYGHHGIDILENAEVNVTSSSVPLNAFYGPINIDSTKKVTAVTTIANGAAIAAGVAQATEPTNVTIKSEVEVSGFVGIAANGTNSNVIIDGGKVTAHSSFIGLYTQAYTDPGIVNIKNGAIVNVIGSGNASPGIATYNRNPQPINIENSTVSVSNYGYGLSGSAITLKDSDVTVASTTCAFLKTPTLDYSTPVTISAGEDADSAVKVLADSITAADYQNKYVKIVPNAQVNITYKLSETDTAPDIYKCFADTEVAIASAPTRDGYVFTGWKDADDNTYYAGEKITPDGDMTLTAQWQEVNDWNQQPSDDNEGRLDVAVAVAVDVDVAVDVGVDADAKVDGTDKLSDGVRAALTAIMNGETPNGMTDEQAADLRALLNTGASKIEAKLTVSAKLETTPTEDELKALLGEAFTSGEEAQKWDLSVTMTTTALSGSDEIGSVENVPITETSPITFSLTTGQNLSGKDVRVLHVLDNSGSTEAVDSSVANAADGTVTFAASKFSPYVILSKTRSSGGHHSSGSTTTYTIKASAGTGGSISPDGSVSVSKGASKTFTITAKDGYEISDVLVDGKSVGAQSSYTFENISASHTIAAQFRKTETVDVTDPAVTGVAGSLQTAAHNVYLRGYPNGSFGPNSQMTRAEAAQMFYNLLIKQDVAASASFSDVADSAWYAPAVKTLASMDVIKGDGGDRFAPERSITRAEFAAIATRFAKTDNSGSVAFRDVESSDWFYSSVLTAVNYGWINGYSDNTFRPENTITRAEVAAIVNRMLARAGDTAYAGSHADEIKQFTDVSDTFWGYSDIIEATNAHDYSKTGSTESWK